MALFGSKKKTEETKDAKTKAVVVKDMKDKKVVRVPKAVVAKEKAVVSEGAFDPSIIIAPRVTEKASFQAEHNVYVFEVSKNSNKKTIALAIKGLFKVTPERVRIAKNPTKRMFVRGKWGSKTGVKKAYVELKKGDKIEIA